MKWVVIVVRTLVGLGFIFSGASFFLMSQADAPKPPTEEAQQFAKVLAATGYFYAVKVCELLGGLLTLSGKLAPLGIALLMPVAVNILFFEIFLLKAPGPGCVIVPLLLFLMWGYRRYFAPFFRPDATVGG
jgi:putative oxidoreductase